MKNFCLPLQQIPIVIVAKDSAGDIIREEGLATWRINGKEYTVEDRGGAIKGNKIDIYMDSHADALAWGVKYLPVQVGQ